MFASCEEAILKDDSGKKSKVSYIAAELCKKGELFDYLANKGGFSIPVTKYYAKQLIHGIYYMHASGVAHRDLKCENILVDDQYDLKITDFGFACPISGDDDRGYCNDYVGSKQYMAPEIHMGVRYQPQTVDWFSFGVILFMMYSGRAPFV